MKKLTDLLNELAIVSGKIYTDKDRPPFKIQEGDIEKKVNTKEVVKRMLKNFKGQYTWVGKAWAKELLGKYKKGISQADFIVDAENLKNTFGGHTGGDDIFKGLNEGKLNEGPSYEYKKDINNIDKSYKLHAKSVLNFYEKLRKKGLDKEASALINTYKKNYVTFKKDYDKIISKLL